MQLLTPIPGHIHLTSPLAPDASSLTLFPLSPGPSHVTTFHRRHELPETEGD